VFFTTDLGLTPEQILREYRGRWSIEIQIREARESFGLGKDRCRNTRKISGINNFRLLMGAAEVLYRSESRAGSREADNQPPTVAESPEGIDQLRPWYEDSGPLKLFDLHWSIREELAGAGITPKVGLRATSGEFEQTGSSAQLRTG